MFNSSMGLASIFPFDPQMDTPLGHRNLVALYVIVWTAQFGYAMYAVNKYRAATKKR
jgi:hypothetical protein